MAVNTTNKCHRSTSVVNKAGAAHAVEQRSRPTTRSMTVSLRQSHCLDVCGRASPSSASAAARPRTGRGSESISDREKHVGNGIRKSGLRNAVSNANKVAKGNARQVPHQVKTKSQTISAAPVSKPGKPTEVRILQLNMQRVTGELRQLIAEKRLDVLHLQEPYAGKLGSSGTNCGLGLGVRVATARSQYPWGAVAICNPDYEICFVSQLSNSHCTSVEVLAPGFSFYVVSCYFQHRDEIEEHLKHLEKVLIAQRGKRLLVSVDANVTLRTTELRRTRCPPRGTRPRVRPLRCERRCAAAYLLDDERFIIHRCYPGVTRNVPIRWELAGQDGLDEQRSQRR